MALGALGAIPSVSRNSSLVWSLLTAALVLVGWQLGLALSARGSKRRLDVVIALRTQHYLQACAQLSVLCYWGWYWRPVYDQFPLIVAQLVFAYAFDMLLTWSRRDRYVLGFGPFPIIFAINLFLWFQPQWFVLQLLTIAVGFTAKEFIRWERDGRRVHIFNPSSLPLALCSLVLILTSTTHHTLGQEISTTLDIPPAIGLWIFLVALPGQYVFGIALMTMSAVVTLFIFGQAYLAVTGTYFFIDSYIPAAVFLGMHLLFTDPSTSPRTDLGRLIFGVLYALSVAGLYSILGAIGAPTFYDKLLAVPLLNLMVQTLDRIAESRVLGRLVPVTGRQGLTPRRRNVVYMATWVMSFLLINASEGVGDVRASRGVPLWQVACEQDRTRGCDVLGTILTQHCVEGSPWACNELGILTAKNLSSSGLSVSDSFRRACDLGSTVGCNNTRLPVVFDQSWQRDSPGAADYLILLQGEENGGIGNSEDPTVMFDRACAAGWTAACENGSEP